MMTNILWDIWSTIVLTYVMQNANKQELTFNTDHSVLTGILAKDFYQKIFSSFKTGSLTHFRI